MKLLYALCEFVDISHDTKFTEKTTFLIEISPILSKLKKQDEKHGVISEVARIHWVYLTYVHTTHWKCKYENTHAWRFCQHWHSEPWATSTSEHLHGLPFGPKLGGSQIEHRLYKSMLMFPYWLPHFHLADRRCTSGSTLTETWICLININGSVCET